VITAESVYLAAIVHGLLQVSVLLFNRRGNRRANAVLAILVGLVVLCMWNLYVYTAELPKHWLLVDYYYWTSIFLWGPALYIYTGLISAQFHPHWTLFLRHFGLTGLLIALQLPLYLLISGGWLGPEDVELFGDILLLAFYLQMGAYFFACFRLLRAYDRKIRENYSRIDSINLSWLNRLTITFAIAVMVDMVLTGLAMVQGEMSPYVAAYLAAEAIAVFAIGYFSMSHPEVLFRTATDEERPRSTEASFDDSFAEVLSARLNGVMCESQAYKKNDLRLSELAEMVGVSRPILSQFINQHHGKNFYDYVNEYRVRSAAERLAADRRANIEKVAYDAGFNNRVSFNKAFNKFMGMTPSQYRRGGRLEVVGLEARNESLSSS